MSLKQEEVKATIQEVLSNQTPIDTPQHSVTCDIEVISGRPEQVWRVRQPWISGSVTGSYLSKELKVFLQKPFVVGGGTESEF